MAIPPRKLENQLENHFFVKCFRKYYFLLKEIWLEAKTENGEIESIFLNIQYLSHLTSNPIGLTPPFVPRGTRLRVVIKNGSDPETEPISLAHVSPLQQANADITAMPSQLDRYCVTKSMGRSLDPQSNR